MKKYKLRGWKEVIEMDFPSAKVTDASKRNLTEYSRHYIGDVRLALGGISTREEYEARRKRAVLD